MAATMEDIVYQLIAIRTDARSASQNLSDDVRQINSLLGQNTNKSKDPGPAAAGKEAPGGNWLSRQMTFIGDSIKKVVVPFEQLGKTIINLGASLVKFVSTINPAAVYRFDMAVGTLMATIGKELVPILDHVTRLLHMLADAFASLSPVTKDLAIGLGTGAGLAGIIAAVSVAVKLLIGVLGSWPTILALIAGAVVGVMAKTESAKKLFEVFGTVLDAVGKIMESLAAVLLPLAETIMPLVVKGLGLVADALTWLADKISWFLKKIGFTVSEYRHDAAKGTPPLKPASFTSIESFGKRAYAMAASGSSGDTAKASLDKLGEILNALLAVPKRFADELMPAFRAFTGRAIGGDAMPEFGKFTGMAMAPAPPGPRLGFAGIEDMRDFFGERFGR